MRRYIPVKLVVEPDHGLGLDELVCDHGSSHRTFGDARVGYLPIADDGLLRLDAPHQKVNSGGQCGRAILLRRQLKHDAVHVSR